MSDKQKIVVSRDGMLSFGCSFWSVAIRRGLPAVLRLGAGLGDKYIDKVIAEGLKFDDIINESGLELTESDKDSLLRPKGERQKHPVVEVQWIVVETQTPARKTRRRKQGFMSRFKSWTGQQQVYDPSAYEDVIIPAGITRSVQREYEQKVTDHELRSHPVIVRVVEDIASGAIKSQLYPAVRTTKPIAGSCGMDGAGCETVSIDDCDARIIEVPANHDFLAFWTGCGPEVCVHAEPELIEAWADERIGVEVGCELTKASSVATHYGWGWMA
tara:strand:+ start:1040 stop:1855 length:816 start_codon:yes stop_codon:yes gene_type:complete